MGGTTAARPDGSLDAVGADGYAADASATVKRAKELLAAKRQLVSA